MKKRKLILLLCLMLVVTMSISACLGKKKKEPPKLNLAVPDASSVKLLNIPLYVAMELGYFKEQGLELTLNYVKTNEEALDQLKSGKADAAFLNIERVIYENKTKDTNGLKTFFYSFQGLGSYLLAREADPSFQWTALKKATIIGHNFDSLSEMALENQLRQNKLIPQEDIVIFRNLRYGLISGAFKGGIGSYLYVFEPIASSLEKEGLGYIVAAFDPEVNDFPLQAYVSKESFLQKYPVASQDFVNALYKAQLWIERYPNPQLIRLVDSHFEDIEKDILAEIINKYKANGFWKPKPIPSEQSMDSLQNILIAGGGIHKKLPSSDLFYTKYAEKAVKTVVLPVEEKKTFWDKVKDFIGLN